MTRPKIVSIEVRDGEYVLTFADSSTNVVTPQGLIDLYGLGVIYVVTIEPLAQGGGVGGVEWRTDRKAADEFLDKLARDLDEVGDLNQLTLWLTTVPSHLTPQGITDYVYDGFVNNDPADSTPHTTMLRERLTGPSDDMEVGALLITGNPVDGLQFRLFPDSDAAISEGESLSSGDWWIAPAWSQPDMPKPIYPEHLLRMAHGLLGDGNGGEWENNPEYRRAIFELVADALGLGSRDEHEAEIEQAIRDAAR
jgi:hypothetical protein